MKKTMDPITAILLFVLILLPSLIFLKGNREKKRISDLIDLIPGPPTYPIIGTNLQFIFTPREDMFLIRRSRSNRYAPIFRSWLGKIPAVHLMKPSYCEAIMNNSVQIKKGPNYDFIRPWLCDGLLTSAGAKWHHRRKLITPTFHFKILDNFVEVFVEKGQELVKQLAPKADGKVFDIYPFITHCALDVICETAMGVTINAMKSANNSEYVRSIYGISEIALQRHFRPWLHSKLIFELSAKGRTFKKYLETVHGFTSKVIKERRQTLANNTDEKQISEEDAFMGKKKRLAFLDLLIEASKNGTVLNDSEIREEVDTFMFEGHDTTTAGICWSLFLLGNHPEIQEKVFEELEGIFHGDDRPITMKDVGEMKYLERVIKESLRLYPSVPFITRQLTTDCEIGGYLLPAGCTAILHIFDVHRDPEQFPDPERFDPDRFLPENAQKRHPYAYIPFSAGPRNCIGQKFALYEEKTLLASIVRKYKIRSAETQSNIQLVSELILRPANGIKLSLEPRNNS